MIVQDKPGAWRFLGVAPGGEPDRVRLTWEGRAGIFHELEFSRHEFDDVAQSVSAHWQCDDVLRLAAERLRLMLATTNN